MKEKGAKWIHRVRNELKWLETDPVEVYYCEFLLAAWVLDHAPWNAYHSGIGFTNNRSNEKILFDFTPDNTSSVMRMIMPEVNADNLARAALLGDVTFKWNDGAHMEFYSRWPEHFTTFTRIGKLTGKQVYILMDWIIDHYMPSYKAFNPVEIVTPHAKPPQKVTALRSRMCHDFVTDSLWVLYEHGAKLRSSGTIFRDHIIMYADSIEAVEENRLFRKKELRYMRSLLLYLDKIKAQFTYAREALIAIWRLRLPVFVHDETGTYHRVQLVPPFLNYCYLPLAIPPDRYDPLGETKLCALGLQANASNITLPYPWGHALAVEETLDQPFSYAAILLTALGVAWAAGSNAIVKVGHASGNSQ